MHPIYPSLKTKENQHYILYHSSFIPEHIARCYMWHSSRIKVGMTCILLLWRHNGRDGVSNHQPHDCLLNRLFRRRSKQKSRLRVTGLCAGNSPGTGEFPAQRASNAENVSIWWRHHAMAKPHIPVAHAIAGNEAEQIHVFYPMLMWHSFTSTQRVVSWLF